MLVEKPFGRDLSSAHELNRILLNTFDESAIFRIDHYLGKRPVNNLHFFRFANAFLEPIPPLKAKDLVRGRFIGYRNEEDVAPDSEVETYAAMRPAILEFFGEWQLEGREMREGDVIVQQAQVPPGWGVRLILGVRVLWV